MVYFKYICTINNIKHSMKKVLLFLAVAASVLSCKKLADNEFEIEGKVDKSLDGKKVFLEKQGGYMGFVPVDTVQVKDGKFVFEGTVTDPSMHFVQVEGLQGKVQVILEHGNIDVEVDKDSIQKSKMGGTYNNDKLQEYYTQLEVTRKKMMNFQNVHKAEIDQVRQTGDQALMQKLEGEYKVITDEMSKRSTEFLDKNPKAYISALLVKQMLTMGQPVEEVRKKFDALAPEVKKTTEGKEVLDMINRAAATPKVAPDAPAAEEANPKTAVGAVAPQFSAPTPEGKTMSLQQAMGKVTVIDFWASWCKPCRMENPNVVALYNEYHSKGLNIIGVSLDKDAAAWKKAIADDKLTWNHISNLKFWEEPIAMQYGVKSIPATFILDGSGKIVARDLRGDELKAKVKELLAVK